MTTLDFARLRTQVRAASVVNASGRVVKACGTLLQVRGLAVRIGDLCRLECDEGHSPLHAEVVGLANDDALLMPFGSLEGISARTRVVPCGTTQSVPVGDALLGRVLDSTGMPIDTLGEMRCASTMPLMASPPPPLSRKPVSSMFETGVRAIDSLLTVGEGQRLGIFAAAGCGKSTLLGMLARRSAADVNVIALIGERGREIQEFIADSLGNDLSRSVLVVSTSDSPALARARALHTATAIAEYFRDSGRRVLLLVDSVTRYARALRDVGLTAGEAPARRGFPPSVFSQLPRILERAGNGQRGSITAFYTVLLEDEDTADPIGEEVRSILDGHIVLSRPLAAANHYPAIDMLNSISRVMSAIVTDEHRQAAAAARRLLAKHREIEVLLQMGEYRQGSDPIADAAVACMPNLTRHLCQRVDENAPLAVSLESLCKAAEPALAERKRAQ